MNNKTIKIKPIYEYTFSVQNIKNILKEIITEMQNNIAKLSETINKDYNNFGIKISIEHLINIASEISKEPILEIGKIDGKEIRDGFGNIGLVYNGNPEITLKTILMSIKTHNNIVLMPKNTFEINKALIEIISNVLNSQNYYNGIVYLTEKYNNVIDYEDFLDKILFVGDKFEYIKLRKQLDIPIEYNGYGYISLIAETDNNLIENIRMYCLNNYINLDYYDSDIEEAIQSINNLKINQTVAIFSNNQESIIKMILKLQTDNIYINKNPLINYNFNLEQESFISKVIIH